MAGKPKIVKKAEKALVRDSANRAASIETPLKEGEKRSAMNKRIRLATAADKATTGKLKPQSIFGKKHPGTKAMGKRINQSIVARGGNPRKLYAKKVK